MKAIHLVNLVCGSSHAFMVAINEIQALLSHHWQITICHIIWKRNWHASCFSQDGCSTS